MSRRRSSAAPRGGRSLVLPVALAIVLAACGEERAPAPPPPTEPAALAGARTPDELLPAGGAAAGWNLLLVTLDTTRADRLGCYGHEGARTPALDGLAARGLRFTEAVTPVPMTLPAHTSLMTGLDPPQHGVRGNGDFRLGEGIPTLAERLAAGGYRTAAFVSSFVLDPRFGLDRGFATYDARLEATRAAAFGQQNERGAAATTDAALAWLGGREEAAPFFLWVHYFDPHDPYAPPEPFASDFREHPYDGEIAYVDAQVARLLAALAASGDDRRTLIVAAGDHGESLGEHGELYHSRTLYEEAVRVPLLVAAPGLVAPGGVVDGAVVSLVDVAPTVLALLGAKGLGETAGRSLLAPGAPERAVYLETLNTYLDNGWAPLYGLRRSDLKYIRAPRPELYDLAHDPGESRNLLPGAEERAAPLAARLEGLLAGQPGIAQVAAAAEAGSDPEIRRRLEALGYLSGAGGGPAVGEGELADPKDRLPDLARLLEARRRIAGGDAEEAARIARDLVTRSPRDRSALQLLGEAYALLGRPEQAERALRRHLELGPAVGATTLLAQVVMQQGRLEEAAALLDRAAELDPEHGAVPLARGDLALIRGRVGEALALYREAARIDPYRFAGLAEARIRRAESLAAARKSSAN